MYFFLRLLDISDKVILANESVLAAQRGREMGRTPAHAQVVEVLEDVGFGDLSVEELVVGKGIECGIWREQEGRRVQALGAGAGEEEAVFWSDGGRFRWCW
jgi:hypothetical protein